MSTFFNVEWSTVNIVLIKGDTVNFCLDVKLNGVNHDFAGETVTAHVRTKNGELIRTFSTGLGTILTNVYRLRFFDIPFTQWGQFCWDVEVDDGTYVMTFIKGNFQVRRDITV